MSSPSDEEEPPDETAVRVPSGHGLNDVARRAESDVKRRLARELHDTVAQILTQMVVEMENFKLDQAGQSQVIERVDSLQESTREVLTNIRQLLYDLREEPAVDSTFVPRIGQLLQRFEKATGIRSKLSVSAGWPAGLAAPIGYNLYRIVEEALNNVRLHSGAAEVDVHLRSLGDDVELTVSDDGSGLPVTAEQRRPGLGIRGMRERAVLLGGAVEIVSHGSGGTTVRAVVPVAAKERTS